MVNSINRIIFQHLFHFKESALRAPCRRAFPFLFHSSVPRELHHIAGGQTFLAVGLEEERGQRSYHLPAVPHVRLLVFCPCPVRGAELVRRHRCPNAVSVSVLFLKTVPQPLLQNLPSA